MGTLRYILICDFDGTITDKDTGDLILSKFAKGDWQRFDNLYDQGSIPMEQSMREQFALVKGATEDSLLKFVAESARVRPGFGELLRESHEAGVDVAVASYGLNFCIDYFLGKVPRGRNLRVYAPKTMVTPDGIDFSFPRLRNVSSANLKDDVVRLYKQRGFKVAFAGDGTSDFPALEIADVRFAVDGSKLAILCDSKGVECTHMTDFAPVTEELTR